ncbi:MAG: ribosome-associated translation inhibitor RaiA [Dehalococcoidales bacterium]|nr:MAG: ribosome-associated translation inhibitor RaiA [Dehalococcoidales bacterium]
MEVFVEGRNCEISEVTSSYIQKKVGKLSRRLRSIDMVKVEITSEPTREADKRFVAQVTASVRDTLLRTEQRAADLYTAINSSVDAMEGQVERYKGRRYDTKRRVNRSKKEVLASKEIPTTLVRTKRFPVQSMSPEEAASQMELLGHQFFLFANADSGELNVVYLRKDGNYGLIQPVLD